jgi:plasmid stabilization system protein ParE
VIAHEIKWSHYAEDDLLNLITYIAKDNPDAAQNLKNQLESKCERLQRFPMWAGLAEWKALMNL